MCKPKHKIVYSEEQLKQDAGHGGIKKVKIEGLFGGNPLDGYLEKPTSGVEANAYVRLMGSDLEDEDYLPKLKMVMMNNVVYDFIDTETREAFRKNFSHDIRGKKLGQIQCKIIFEDLGYKMKKQWKSTTKLEMIDVKIGTRIYDNDELKMNGRQAKAPLTKLQMDMTVKNAEKGGAVGYQVAKGDKIKRQIEYINSKKNVQAFFKKTKIRDSDVLGRLDKVKDLFIKEKVSFVGSSVLFVKDEKGRVAFACIDIDHAVFKDAAAQYKGLFERVQESYNQGLNSLWKTIYDAISL
jgi:hypothetical protein